MAECEEITGSGCGLLVSPPDVSCEDGAGVSDTSDDTGSVRLHGSGCGARGEAPPECAVAAGPGWASVLLLLWLWARRVALCFVAGVLPFSARADGLNAEQLAPGDGGPSLAIYEADLGERGSLNAGFTWSFARRPVVARFKEGTNRVLLDGVGSGTLGVSARVLEGPRIGMALRYMQWSFVDRVEGGFGDTMLWATVPVLESRGTGFFAAVTVDLVLPTGPSDVYLEDEAGALDGLASGRWSRDSFAADVQLGVRLQRDQVINNVVWGPRYRWAVALSARPWGWGLVTAEAFGSGALAAVPDAEAVTPIEANAYAGVCFFGALCVRGGLGSGLTYGVGAPDFRATAAVDWRRPPRTDADGDGIIDLKDRCMWVPEDMDLVADEDGCPEADGDGDGFEDADDRCPLIAETVNQLRDDDGCPDRIATLTLLVTGVADLDAETALVDGLTPTETTVFFDEPTVLRVEDGFHRYTVEADGYAVWHGAVDVSGRDPLARVELVPIRYGRVRLRLVDPASVPLSGFVRRPDAEGGAGPAEAVPAVGIELRTTIGPSSWAVHVPGYSGRKVAFEVRRDELLEVLLTLAPVDLRLEGDRIITTREIAFDLDRAVLRADGQPVLEDIASLLAARPDIELLRIEGHADESGTSRHNLDLSRDRAEAVRDALVARGVVATRLEAIGSGEARQRDDTRTVGFTVLVWSDQ